MKERSLTRDEVKVVFYALDPFPKEFQITVSKENGDTAEAALGVLHTAAGRQPAIGGHVEHEAGNLPGLHAVDEARQTQ